VTDDKLPWFPFWAADFLLSRKVRRMTAEQRGVYISLLTEQWMDGPLPDSETELCAMSNASPKAVLYVLERCFDLTESGWINARLEEVRAEQEKRRLRYRKAGQAGAKARYSKGKTSNRIAMPKQPHSSKSQSQSKNKTTIGEYDESFSRFWDAYPDRPNRNKRETHRVWLMNLKNKIDPQAMIAGAARYRSYVEQTRTEPQYVKQPKTFIGPDRHWEVAWIVTENLQAKEQEVSPLAEFNRQFEARTREATKTSELEAAGLVAARVLGGGSTQ